MPEIITNVDTETPVPESILALVREGEAAGISPKVAPRPSSPADPRAHLPTYDGLMPGQLPLEHPAVRRQQRTLRAQRAREKERARAQLAAEAAVPDRFRLGTRVRIQRNAKVDYENEDGKRIRGDYAGIEGEIFQTYVDPEGKRRAIIVDRDAENGGHSRYAPVAVREGDLVATRERKSVSFARGLTPAERAARAAASPEDLERAAFGGLTAKELADRMCGASSPQE